MKKCIFFLLTLSIISCNNSDTVNDNSEHLQLWYDRPAQEWVEALPIGNGKIGAMVYGNPECEWYSLNEESLWSGRPVNINPNPDAVKVLPLLRQALSDGDLDKANELSKQMQGVYTQSYMPMADLRLDFDLQDSVVNYRRSLDISHAIQITEYEAGGVKYRRESLVSAPDNVMAVKISADQKGALNFTVSLSSQLNNTVLADGNRLMLNGIAPVHADPNYVNSPEPIIYEIDGKKGMRFQTSLIVDADGGKVIACDSILKIENANQATLYLTAATSFNGFDKDPYVDGKDEKQLVNDYLNNVKGKRFENIKSDHVKDYKKYFDRVEFKLADTENRDSLDTFQRLVAYRNGASDPSLEALYYQFGRYLLISCSRPDNVAAANLQGIWNPHLRAPWSSNYTTNINAQMNYWPAEMCNLSELHIPFINQIKRMSTVGSHTAKNFYDCDGWVLCHNSDIWGQTNPVGNCGEGDPMWANWQMGAPWVCQHLYDHFKFTCDTAYLATEAYPIMKEASKFCVDWLVEDADGRLVTSPSTSPENSFYGPDGKAHSVTVGSTMDMSLIWDLFSNVIEASEILGQDEDYRNMLIDKRSKLLPLKISENGYLQEWISDYKETDMHHRHVSHLIGLHPGHQITPFTTPDYAKACKVSLENRGDEGTGWSSGWKINLWARLLDGDHAYKLLRNLLRVVGNLGINYENGGGTYYNMFCAHPPFQIDGNFGGLSGMTEMLLQSHAGDIHLLPALPSAWPEGSIKGLKARGGFEVDMDWNQGSLTAGKIKSRNGGTCRLRTGKPVSVKGVDCASEKVNSEFCDTWITVFETQPGKVYELTSID